MGSNLREGLGTISFVLLFVVLGGLLGTRELQGADDGEEVAVAFPWADAALNECRILCPLPLYPLGMMPFSLWALRKSSLLEQNEAVEQEDIDPDSVAEQTPAEGKGDPESIDLPTRAFGCPVGDLSQRECVKSETCEEHEKSLSLDWFYELSARKPSMEQGTYSKAERKQALRRYAIKRKRIRNGLSRPYCYLSRKLTAQAKVRVGGRFVAASSD